MLWIINLCLAIILFDLYINLLVSGELFYVVLIIKKCTPNRRNEYLGLIYYHVVLFWYMTQRNGGLNLLLCLFIFLEPFEDTRKFIYENKQLATLRISKYLSVKTSFNIIFVLYSFFPLIIAISSWYFLPFWILWLCHVFIVTVILMRVIFQSTRNCTRLYVFNIYRIILLCLSFTNLLK